MIAINDVVDVLKSVSDPIVFRNIARDYKWSYGRYDVSARAYVVSPKKRRQTYGFLNSAYAYTMALLLTGVSRKEYVIEAEGGVKIDDYSATCAISALIQSVYKIDPDCLGRLANALAERGCQPWDAGDTNRYIVCNSRCHMFPLKKFSDHVIAHAWATMMSILTGMPLTVFVHS